MEKNYVRIEAHQSLNDQGDGKAVLNVNMHENGTLVISVDVPCVGGGFVARAELTAVQVKQLAMVIVRRPNNMGNGKRKY